MTSSDSWICDGIPKDGKEYPGLGGAHEPCKNFSTDCEICGLPKESSTPKSPPFPIKTVIIAAIALIATIAGGNLLYTIVFNSCEPGLEKIDGQCVDPFLQLYQEATQEGDRAITIANSYQTLEDLQSSSESLKDAIAQLNTIPENAPVYGKDQNNVADYQNQLKAINTNLNREQEAQQLLSEAEDIVNNTNTSNLSSITDIQQLEQAQTRLKEAVETLQLISNNSLVADKKEERLTEYQTKIENIDDRISNLKKLKQEQKNKGNQTLPSCDEVLFGPCI